MGMIMSSKYQGFVSRWSINTILDVMDVSYGLTPQLSEILPPYDELSP